MTATAPTLEMPALMISNFNFATGGKVDVEAGAIRDVAIVTEGEAKGHGVWLDESFVDEVVKQGNGSSNGKTGVKARFGHPSMSSTAMGSFLGRFKHFTKDSAGGKSIARADLFLSSAAKKSPQGNLYDYTLELADDDAKAFGASIVFKPGERYVTEKGKKAYIRYEADGPFSTRAMVGDRKLKKEEKIFVECKELRQTDVVDDPAANPDGLFSAFDAATIAGQVSEFLDTHPEVFEMLANKPNAVPSMVEGFMQRYGAVLKRRESPMSGTETTETGAADAVESLEEQAEDAQPDGQGDTPPEPEADATEEPEEDKKPDPNATDEVPAVDAGADDGGDTQKPDAAQSVPGTGDAFLKEFGDQGGVWFAKGLSLEQARGLYVEKLKTENAEMREKLKQIGETGGAPASFATAPDKEEETDFMQVARELSAAKKIGITEAMSIVASEQPELYQKNKNEAGK